MKRVPLVFPLLISCFFAVFNSAIIPSVKLLPFSPFLAILYNRTSFHKSLWVACLCGVIIDLFSTDLRLGIHALNDCLVTALLYHQKRHFFEDKPLALCLFTGLISWISTLTLWVLIPLSGGSFSLSQTLLMTDLLLLPMADMGYAFVCFCCPLLLYSHIQKIGWKAFYSNLMRYLHIQPKRSTDESN